MSLNEGKYDEIYTDLWGRNEDYDDIINLPHHESTKYEHMNESDRAAQFAPFAALTGYGDVIEEAARSNEEYMEQEIEHVAAEDISSEQERIDGNGKFSYN